MKTKRPMGRPKTDRPTRSKAIMFYMTPEDAEWFNQFANDYGFKSRSQLITGIMESLRLCGLSPLGCLRMGSALQGHCEKNNSNQARQGGFDFHTLKLRPISVIPDMEEPSTESIKSMISELQKQLKKANK